MQRAELVHGGACVFGCSSGAVGGGVAEVVALLFTLGCRPPKQGGANFRVRSPAPQSACARAQLLQRTRGVLFVHRFGAGLIAHILNLCMLDGVIAPRRQGLVARAVQVDREKMKRVQVEVRQCGSAAVCGAPFGEQGCISGNAGLGT